ncbi:hypothetical protein GCM10018962_08900 [Dactylosporangium matsuzakiense]|uniref:Uncharacterized protein n=1 Tax=Dactylosporangium matsuzakiense TaxID=53360 RepID=A0A9W6NJB7_9ACTN|nr:hypothetical protein GCM10017581_006430 [Dactylosporangium matsuzakiense]
MTLIATGWVGVNSGPLGTGLGASLLDGWSDGAAATAPWLLTVSGGSSEAEQAVVASTATSVSTASGRRTAREYPL